MDKVPRDAEVPEFEKQGWWKTLYMIFFGDLCTHQHWISGGYGAYCWRCMKHVEPTDMEK